MKHIFFLMSVCMLFATVSGAQDIDWEQRIPDDPHIVKGRLDNGITYYLRHNEEPKERASFFIVRNVGALLEDDNQNGLAHFLEHLAFNGSLNFPGNSMISTLQRHGVSYGDNVNAYTTQNETVYNISDVPTTDAELIDTCLLILHDWTYYLTLAPEAIDAERGVIIEEWRSRNNSGTRLWKQKMPVLYKDSKYAERDVIGDTAVISSCDPETIRDFYYKWYRTDLEAIVIVGDFDVRKMEEKIKAVFEEIPAVTNAVPRPFYEIPSHEETYYCLCTDKEATSSNVQVVRFFRDPEYDGKGYATYRDVKNWLMMGFYNTMLSARINETIQQGNAPYVNASVGFYETVRGYYSYSIFAQAKPNEEKEALEGVLDEHLRVVQHGFTETELDRAKADLLTALETAVKEKDKTTNDEYAEELHNLFLENNAVIYVDDYVAAVKEIIPFITSQEVAAQVERWWKTDNRVIVVSGPSEGISHIGREEALGLLTAADTKSVAPYIDNTVEGALLAELPQKGNIVHVKKLADFDAEEWTLSNGAKVVWRHADYEKDDVALYAFSAGGLSLYDDNDMLPAAANAGEFASYYGVGNYDNVSLNKLLTGRTARCGTSVDELYESVIGNSTPKDFETMMQLLYLRFTAPRFDSIAHNVLLEKNYIRANQIAGLPQTMMRDSIHRILSDYNPRVQLFNKEYVEKLSLERIEQVYRERFSDAADFIFIIVGNVCKDSAKLMAEQYIAPIPSTYRKEQWIDRMVRGPQENTERLIHLPLEEPKSTVLLNFEAEMDYNVKEDCIINLLADILTTRYTQAIREDEGGTYGVGVSGNAQREPYNNYSMYMYFECDPDKTAELKPLLYMEIDKIRAEGITQEELDKVVKSHLKELEQERQHNAYWLSMLATFYKTGINYNDPENAEKLIKSISTKDVEKFAHNFFKHAVVTDLTFAPEKTK